MSVLDDYLVHPGLSLLEKTRIQAQVLVPVLRALRSELGKEKADAIVQQALRGWSKQLFAAVGDSVEWQSAAQMGGDALRDGRHHRVRGDGRDAPARQGSAGSDVTQCRFADSFARSASPRSARC